MQSSAPTGLQADSRQGEEETLLDSHPTLIQSVALRTARVNLKILKNILSRLTGFFQLSEEEKNKAGIYLGDRHYK
ncbi:MAG: hypothetical protein BGO78_02310 [Chloroflexi bacterium 44-23]|nr:MAG: hypothetical protein BGO78_02310 [Chloroflexi bacterium 44-23]